jgi:hypothetical protein
VAPLIKTGANQEVVVHLTPFLDGTFTAPNNAWTAKVDQLTFDGSNNLTQFTFLVEPSDPVDALPASVKIFFTIITNKTFFATDEMDIDFQVVTRMDQ